MKETRTVWRLITGTRWQEVTFGLKIARTSSCWGQEMRALWVLVLFSEAAGTSYELPNSLRCRPTTLRLQPAASHRGAEVKIETGTIMWMRGGGCKHALERFSFLFEITWPHSFCHYQLNTELLPLSLRQWEPWLKVFFVHVIFPLFLPKLLCVIHKCFQFKKKVVFERLN